MNGMSITRLRRTLHRTLRRISDGARHCRIPCPRRAAVLALCLVAALTTGFWANTTERGRGVSAIRMRIDFKALPPASPELRNPSHATFTAFDYPLLPHTRAHFRATVRDVRKGPGPKNATVDKHRDTGARSFMDALFSLDAIADMQPETSVLWPGDEMSLSRDGDWMTNANRSARAHWIFGNLAGNSNECLLPADGGVTEDMHRLLLRMRLPVGPESLAGRPERYAGMIEPVAKRFGLSPRLIYGIMRTESSFNPFAVSNAGALGLMQLVPDTAAAEVHSYLGREGSPTRSLLFDPRQNIEYGGAYLHLLATRYFPQVHNRISRELCVIAAYNAGPGSVLRLFDPNRDAALAAINMLTPEEVYTRLIRDMPSEETRQYVGKVLSALNTYSGG